MAKCPKCGEDISKKHKFCDKCGEKLVKESKRIFTPNIIAIIFVAFVFIGLISAVTIFLNQGSPNNELDLVLSEEKVLDIRQQIKEIKSFEEKRLGGVSNTKPFADGNYAYDERTVDFRLVCTHPCPLSKDILDQEFAAISYAVSTARGLTKTDIDDSIMPFEVHASEDEVCPMIPSALAYMNTFTDGSGYTRGKLCFFFDKLNYNRDKFPYSTSIHEVMHLFEVNKVPHDSGVGGSVLWEGLSEMMESFFLKGNEMNSFCWNGNKWWLTELGYNPHDSHDVGRNLFFELCNDYGFDYDSLPTLFRELDRRGGDTNEGEFVNIVNNIVGSDTSHIFRNAGVI